MENKPSPKATLTVRVESYAGYRGEETPRRFTLAGRDIEVGEVVDRWHGPDHRYFKVRAGEGEMFILCHDIRSFEWRITLFTREDYLVGSQTHQLGNTNAQTLL